MLRTGRSFRGSWRDACAALAGAAVGAVAFEAGYRMWLYRQLLDRTTKQLLNAHDLNSLDAYSAALHRSSNLDEHLGHRYRPHLRFEMVLSLENLSPRRFNTNSHGHISDVEYPVEKPSGEYRIVVIGDSFTAGVTNSVRWPDELERELRRHGLDRCRVINVGLDGISASQFIDVYKHEARRFEPDMVVVNILADNLPRPPYSRGAHNLETRPEAAREFARSHFVDPLPWWNPTPELVARKPFGQRLGFRPKLDPQLRKASLDEGQAFAASLQSLREIQRLHPRVLVLYHPTFEDWTGTLRPQLAELRERLFSEADDLRIVDMAAELPDLAAAGASLQRWYQIPTDGHPSDEGMRRYGAAAARPVLARIGNRP